MTENPGNNPRQRTTELYNRFWEVHDVEPTTHPLFIQMADDLKAGRRGMHSLLADLEEAARHRKKR